MIYKLLATVIEQQNSFMTRDMIILQIEFFYTAGRITKEEKNKLLEKLNIEINDENEIK